MINVLKLTEDEEGNRRYTKTTLDLGIPSEVNYPRSRIELIKTTVIDFNLEYINDYVLTYSCKNLPINDHELPASVIIENSYKNYKCIFLGRRTSGAKFHRCFEFKLAPLTYNQSSINRFRRNFSNSYISNSGYPILSIYNRIPGGNDSLTFYTYNPDTGNIEWAKNLPHRKSVCI